jgi:flagellar basal body rod protein FlgG
MALDRIGVNSLLAVNEWIGVINANLQSSSRTGYKTTRANMTDGRGINPIPDVFNAPPSTLTLSTTTVEWGQGTIVNSTEKTHFAIKGEGFFILQDRNGKYYASRDGEFHWSGDGYLVNSAGLRVISTGQDYIRLGQLDRSDDFRLTGESVELDKYGNKTIMIADFGNLQGLRMSRYGSTVFEVNGNLPSRLQNDFTSTTDGVSFIYEDPQVRAIIDDPGFTYGQTVDIDLGSNNAGYVDSTNRGTPLSINITNATSIQDIVNAINLYGAGVGNRVRARYDENNDRLIIENQKDEAAPPVPPQDNSIRFDGVNGDAFRKFFRVENRNATAVGSDPVQRSISTRDIDNSSLTQRNALDINAARVNQAIATLVTSPLPPTYVHDRVNGYVLADASGAVGRAAGLSVGQSATTGEFEMAFDFKVSDGSETNINPPGGPLNGNSQIIIGFGQKDPLSLNSGGFDFVYDALTGAVEVRLKPRDQNSPSAVLYSGFLGTGVADLPANLAAIDSARMAVSVDRKGILTVSILDREGGNNIDSVSFDLGGLEQERRGAISIRNTENQLQVSNLEVDFKGRYNGDNSGDMVLLNATRTGTPEIKNDWQDRKGSTLVQSALESSTASLSEYVPMLGLAQKVFSAVSKIINVHNGILDDLNNTIR